jgi:pteridine reductase
MIMAQQPEGGAIVTIGDWSIERPGMNHVAYYLAKGAIPTLTRALAVELAARNPKVRVNCVHPGPVMFPPSLPDERREEIRQATLLKMADQPEWAAQAVKFLIANKFITGVCLPVDAGRSIYANDVGVE